MTLVSVIRFGGQTSHDEVRHAKKKVPNPPEYANKTLPLDIALIDLGSALRVKRNGIKGCR